MPEEINRILTDHLADLLFTTETSGNENLRREGIPEEKVHFVGNTMIDTLVRLLPKAEARWPDLRQRFGLNERYVLVTLHRPSNVDDPATLSEIMAALHEIAHGIQVIFPAHPRTRKRLTEYGLSHLAEGLCFTEPLGYLEFLALQAHASLVLTDSGGIQEETTYLDVLCLTVRENTERPVTLVSGTNQLVAPSRELLREKIESALTSGKQRGGSAPELWDGKAAERIVKVFG
jgi:UDP-N-acetylglucosamine 2-epimerase (non-hydrolysing)